MNKEEIIEMASKTPVEVLIANHSAKELRAMYVELAGEDIFPKATKKEKIASAIKGDVRSKLRGKAFSTYA